MTYLQQLFNKFNNDYFDRACPPMALRFSSIHIPEWGICYEQDIVLSPVLKKYQLALEGILIHEMIHARLYEDDHTAEFLKLQRKLNKRHFGEKGNHRVHYQAMIRDLDKTGRI